MTSTSRHQFWLFPKPLWNNRILSEIIRIRVIRDSTLSTIKGQVQDMHTDTANLRPWNNINNNTTHVIFRWLIIWTLSQIATWFENKNSSFAGLCCYFPHHVNYKCELLSRTYTVMYCNIQSCQQAIRTRYLSLVKQSWTTGDGSSARSGGVREREDEGGRWREREGWGEMRERGRERGGGIEGEIICFGCF